MLNIDNGSQEAGCFPDARTDASVVLSYTNIEWVAALVSAIVIILSAIVAGVGYHLLALGIVPDIEVLFGAGLIAAILHVVIGRAADLYRLPVLLAPNRHMGRIAAIWAAAMLTLTLAMFLLKIGATYSRGSMVFLFAVGLGAMFAFHWLLGRHLSAMLDANRLRRRRALLIGDREELQAISDRDLRRLGAVEVERAVLPETNGSSARSLEAQVQRLLEVSRDKVVDLIVLVMSWRDVKRLDLVRHQLRLSPLAVYLLPDRAVSAVLSVTATGRGSLTVEIQREPLGPMERAVKRLFDVAVGSVLIVSLAVILVICAIAIKLESPGPVLFRQRRRGFNGAPFVIYKFRTMNVLEDGGTIRQAKRNDPRVTRVGRFLRKTSIDELPQLFNVLKGDMSLVGPRPHALAHDDEYGRAIAAYAFRHHVKPGITGWAQIKGYRGETARLCDMEKRVEHDLWYINNWSIWLDIRILLQTSIIALGQRTAY